MNEIDNFVTKFGGMTEEYVFYNGEVTLRYDPKEHVYLLVKDGQLIPQDGVTNTVHIIDKSQALMPWATKMMAEKLLRLVPVMTLPSGESVLGQMTLDDLKKFVNEAKTAHKDKLEEASDVGSMAHAWLEQLIKTILAGDVAAKEKLLGAFPTEERAKNCCVAALDWIQKHNVRWVCTEKKIYSRKHGFAGTLDGLGVVDSCSDRLCCPNEFKNRLSLVDWKSSNGLRTEYLYQTAAYLQASEEENSHSIKDRWIIRLGKEDGEFEPWHLEADTFEDDLKGFLNALALSRSVQKLESRMRAVKTHIKDEKKKAKDAEKARLDKLCKEEKAKAKAEKKEQKAREKALLKEVAAMAKAEKKLQKQLQKQAQKTNN